MNILIMADGDVGWEITKWLLENYIDDIYAVVTTTKNNIYDELQKKGVRSYVYESEAQLVKHLNQADKIDLGLLLWWPKIIKNNILNLAQKGFINTHPSFLPFNRGKHYNFWALVEEAPFGVSLHFVDESIDSGDLIAQSRINYNWEDNGETLYKKAAQEMVALFKRAYPEIRKLHFNRTAQNLESGSIHYAQELEEASKIELDKQYKARDLLNLLRARTFKGFSSCWFEDNEVKYEVRITINKK
jgi:methionyl-tRNA formyltransferase